MITWLVRFGDLEKNFPTKAAAVSFLRRWTHDPRPCPPLQSRGPFAWRYFGPGEEKWVLVADIDRLLFPPLTFYRARKSGQQKLAAVTHTKRESVR